MSIHEIVLAVGLLLSVISNFIAFFAFWFTRQKYKAENAAEFAKLELKVDTLWDFQMRRSVSELISRNIGGIRWHHD